MDRPYWLTEHIVGPLARNADLLVTEGRQHHPWEDTPSRYTVARESPHRRRREAWALGTSLCTVWVRRSGTRWWGRRRLGPAEWACICAIVRSLAQIPLGVPVASRCWPSWTWRGGVGPRPGSGPRGAIGGKGGAARGMPVAWCGRAGKRRASVGAAIARLQRSAARRPASEPSGIESLGGARARRPTSSLAPTRARARGGAPPEPVGLRGRRVRGGACCQLGFGAAAGP
eukprot:scaffold2956_cov390-Prasinococcus_capsulatus_cf.AAC.1